MKRGDDLSTVIEALGSTGSGIVTRTPSATIGGTCFHHDIQTLTSSCPTPTTTPYGVYFFPNNTYNGKCQMIQLCNDINFHGSCVSVPLYVNNLELKSCKYLSPMRNCIDLPSQDDSNYRDFQLYYGKSSWTLSVRPGADLLCSLFGGVNCTGAWEGYINDEPGMLTVPRKGFERALSFHCWPAAEAQPGWSLISPSPSLTEAPTRISVVPDAASSIETALQGDFDPFVNEALLCQYKNMTKCAAIKTAGLCWTFRKVYDGMNIEYVEALAAGFDYLCMSYTFVLWAPGL